MKIPFADLHAQYNTIKTEIDQAIANTLANTDFIGGTTVTKFENEFAQWQNTKHCISCANGTDSIEILLQAMGIGAGDEVIVPAHSWISTSEAVSYIGAKPVFADCHPDYYTILPERIKEKITAKTKAIIPVHIYGCAAPMNEILEIAKQHSLLVLEDCAQAHGAMYHGKKVGNMGDCASFSFYPGKNLGAYGDAGCMITNNEQIAERARMIANHGQKGKHNHLIEGRNSRLDALQAAILSVKLPHLDRWNENRIKAANWYNKYLQNVNAIKLPQTPADCKHVYHLYVIQIENREELVQKLNEANIGTAVHYPHALPFLPCYSPQQNLADYPNSGKYQHHIISLPIFDQMTEEQVAYVSTELSKIYQ